MMVANRVVVKYFNRQMLLTLDLSALFEKVFDAFGDSVSIEFTEMNEREKAESSNILKEMLAVRERFWILDVEFPNSPIRRQDLEKTIVAVGRK